MSKKVLFYLALDSIGIAITDVLGKYLCKISDAVTNPWVSNGINLVINFLWLYNIYWGNQSIELYKKE